MKKTKKYRVHYSYLLEDSRVVEAESGERAEDIVRGMLERGEIGNMWEMDVNEQKVWVERKEVTE